jgi:hypothetical protein
MKKPDVRPKAAWILRAPELLGSLITGQHFDALHGRSPIRQLPRIRDDVPQDLDRSIDPDVVAAL